METTTKYSFASSAEPTKGETAARRNNLSEELVKHPENCCTLYESMERAAKNFSEKPCLGVRKILKEQKKEIGEGDDKKTWTFYELSEYNFHSFAEAYQKMRFFASGLRDLGMKPVSDIIIIFKNFSQISNFRKTNLQFMKKLVLNGVLQNKLVILKTSLFLLFMLILDLKHYNMLLKMLK